MSASVSRTSELISQSCREKVAVERMRIVRGEPCVVRDVLVGFCRHFHHTFCVRWT
jgi:hypothetical protein